MGDAPRELPLLAIDRIIHEPARLAILSQLYVVDVADFLFVMHRTGLTQGNLSSHLSKLEFGGYVDIDKVFVEKRPRTLLRLTDQGRSAFEAYIDGMQTFLDDIPDRRPA